MPSASIWSIIFISLALNFNLHNVFRNIIVRRFFLEHLHCKGWLPVLFTTKTCQFSISILYLNWSYLNWLDRLPKVLLSIIIVIIIADKSQAFSSLGKPLEFLCILNFVWLTRKRLKDCFIFKLLHSLIIDSCQKWLSEKNLW